ncbi:MAG: phytanoyl-CoA dioxygenase family protein, partial [Alphaproteobacteria bacterium]|nr:phytanoyl-CoA dioxygenase family protein [Alphaproteobacteria bacterium]
MDTRTALRQLRVGDADFTAGQRQAFDRDGYFAIERAFSPVQCAAMAAEFDRLYAAEGERAGREVSLEPGAIRLSNVFNKSTAFDCLLDCKPLLAATYYLLGEFKVHGANMREPQMGTGQQPLHCDIHRLPNGEWVVVNALILFDDITLDNGPTRIVPGSHRWPALNVPGENATDYNVGPRREPHTWAIE